MKKPYRCLSCKKLFPYEDRIITERSLYNIVTIKEDACPFCKSTNISWYGFNHCPENKYLNHYDVVNDKRYYNK